MTHALLLFAALFAAPGALEDGQPADTGSEKQDKVTVWVLEVAGGG